MKVRIIAGTYGSRFIEAPPGNATHPMSERVRNALFNMLGDISDATALDPFGGSGALAIEAISRGAKSAVVIEKDRRAYQTIVKNLAMLKLQEHIKAIQATALAWSEHNQQKQFDLILVDPPYHNLQLSTVSALTRHLKRLGYMVLSYPGRESAPTVNGVVVVDKRSYGDAALAIYRKEV